MLKEDVVKPFEKYNEPVPRYTSYPTAPQFTFLEEKIYQKHLLQSEGDFSLYVHIPFCAKMCLFCACSVILNRKPEKQSKYLQALYQEMKLIHSFIGKKRVMQLHFGGGTPTSLTEAEFTELWEKLHKYFSFAEDAELSIEIDPRTVFQDEGKKLTFLKKLGFNRVSFGVQDLNATVQEAVKRRQTYEMSEKTIRRSQSLGFLGVNVDLIYGLPYQTKASFSHTLEQILSFSVDRVVLFSYAHVPWLKAHQKAIPEKALPSTEEKFIIYQEAKKLFIKRGYVEIGMDHFAKEKDSLTFAKQNKTMLRNFQGYTTCRAPNLLGLGVTSVGKVQGLYVQNVKDLSMYYEKLSENKLPICKGHVMTEEDQIRSWVIQQIMCYYSVDKKAFSSLFKKDFDFHFTNLQKRLQKAEEENLIENNAQFLRATNEGKWFVRNIACLFDAYFVAQKEKYSKGI